MPRLSAEERQRAISNIEAGWSIPRVARLYGTHQSTIYRLLDRYQQTDTVSDRARSGRPRVTSESQDCIIVNSHRQNRFLQAASTARKTIGTTNRPISINTVRRRLDDSGLRCRRCPGMKMSGTCRVMSELNEGSEKGASDQGELSAVSSSADTVEPSTVTNPTDTVKPSAVTNPTGTVKSSAVTNSVTHPTDAGSGDTLEGLVSTLKTQIKNSNWLAENTAERWEQDNPALAAEYKKRVAEGNAASSANS